MGRFTSKDSARLQTIMSKKATRFKHEHVPVQNTNGLFCGSATPIQVDSLLKRGVAVPLTRDLSGEVPNWRDRKDYFIGAVRLTMPADRPEMARLITRGEILKNAGIGSFKGDRSLTKGLSDERRAAINDWRIRNRKPLLPEQDFAELVMGKMEAYPETFDFESFKDSDTGQLLFRMKAVMVPSRAY